MNFPTSFEIRNDNRTAYKPWIGNSTYFGVGMIITGPASLTCKGICISSLKITSATELAGASQSIAKYASVIPENAKTNVSVILEQSTDLVNWTAANPGDLHRVHPSVFSVSVQQMCRSRLRVQAMRHLEICHAGHGLRRGCNQCIVVEAILHRWCIYYHQGR